MALEGPKPSQVAQNNLFNKIAICESNDGKNNRNSTSTAAGRFQFLSGTWKWYGKELWGDDIENKDVMDYNDNTELAWYVFSTYGTKDWNASKGCWSSASVS